MRRAGASAAALLLSSASPALAWDHSVAHVFKGPNGANPVGGVVTGADGNIYGVTRNGGAFGEGTVFMMSPPVAGKVRWSETILHSFNHATGDGAYPAAGLVQDADGSLYGTTAAGGAQQQGTVFKLTQGKTGGAWSETILHSFGDTSQDGTYPASQLITGPGGRLFGATFEGGSSGYGTVFELDPPARGHGAWSETVLHSFAGIDGSGPIGNLVADGAGNLFGASENGGASNDGAVFELTPPADGQSVWKTSVVVSFSYNAGTGVAPLAGVVFNGAGDLVGTTYAGGKHGAGAVFVLHPSAHGETTWREQLVYSFVYDAKRGSFPASGVIFDSAGNLYGTTQSGGKYNNGIIFQLSPPAQGKPGWTENVLHAFAAGTGSDTAPNGTVVPDGSGGVFGTSYDGGKLGYGTLFRLTP